MPFEPETPFGKAIKMFLEDRLMAFKPENMDIQYSERYGAAGRLEERLLSVLPETIKIVYAGNATRAAKMCRPWKSASMKF